MAEGKRDKIHLQHSDKKENLSFRSSPYWIFTKDYEWQLQEQQHSI